MKTDDRLSSSAAVNQNPGELHEPPRRGSCLGMAAPEQSARIFVGFRRLNTKKL